MSKTYSAAIAQILTVQSQHTEILNSHTQILNNHTADLAQLKSDVGEILRILRDAYGGKLRNGGSGL
ncbi:hypothetical protein [uncultured Nostoc sp.]|uniref:hypothetical protein n=1 Tax=uncultured Nostoc sp. TaxID=340711 RepID=UPI0035CC14F3